MTDNERLKKVILWLTSQGMVDSQEDVAIKLGINPTYLSQVVSGNKILSKKLILKLCKVFDKVNPNYIIYEEGLIHIDGEMLNPTHEESGIIGLPGKSVPYSVLLLPISAQGGSLNEFFVSVKDTECERVISPIKNADFAITVSGESMAPEYPNGSQILIKKINERAFIDWGKVFVLDTCNGTIIKRIGKSEKEGCITCYSLNPDPIYDPYDICMKDIFGMYRIMLCMSTK